MSKFLETSLKLYARSKLRSEETPFYFRSTNAGTNDELDQKSLPLNNITEKMNQDIINFKNVVGKFGLASCSLCQFGLNFRILTILREKNLIAGKWFNYRDMSCKDYEIFINPVLKNQWSVEEVEWEYCASTENLKVSVRRPTQIEIEFVDDDLTAHSRILSGFRARLFLHELDHLEGRSLADLGFEEDNTRGVKDFNFEEFSVDFDFENVAESDQFVDFFEESKQNRERNLGEIFYGDDLDPNLDTSSTYK